MAAQPEDSVQGVIQDIGTILGGLPLPTPSPTPPPSTDYSRLRKLLECDIRLKKETNHLRDYYLTGAGY